MDSNKPAALIAVNGTDNHPPDVNATAESKAKTKRETKHGCAFVCADTPTGAIFVVVVASFLSSYVAIVLSSFGSEHGRLKTMRLVTFLQQCAYESESRRDRDRFCFKTPPAAMS